MLCLLAINNQTLRFSTSNNKDVQRIATKHLPLYYGATKTPNNSNPFIFGFSTVGIRSRKSKCIIKNKDSPTTAANAATKKQNGSNPFIQATSIESICNWKSKCTNTENNNNK